MTIINLEIFGMSCEGCVNTVKMILKKYKGVKNVEVNLIPPTAKILCDENILPADLIKFLEENSKYKAVVKID
ncbi:MAG: heavy-metal-associated domain-containing protein [Spirochaetes bacterium]|nr:heavy-metal-associated domain-containing protein [Spirochaetota bacterium]